MYNQITSNKRKTILLITVFIIVVLGLGYLYDYLYGYGSGGLILAGVISLGMAMISYYSGDKLALTSAGAKPISKEQNIYVWRIVENLCIAQGLPMPKLHLIQDPGINAFATGRDPKHASIAVTTGAIEKLTNEELEGVLAHELSHIKNYDIRLMMVVIVLVGIISLISNWMLRTRFHGGGSSRGGRGNAGAILLVIGLIAFIIAPIVAELIKLAVSRKREYLADASSALMTRYPQGLANALEKIAQSTQPLTRANRATAHLYISNPFGEKRKWLANAFSTHPSIQDRIKVLRGMQ